MAEETRTFDGAIALAKEWSKVQFEDATARLLVQHYSMIHQSPNADPELWERWETFRHEEQDKIKERLEYGTDWTKTKGHALVLLRNAFDNTQKGISHFLPMEFSNAFTQEEKQALWAWYLLVLGVRIVRDPYYYLRPSTIFFMCGPYVEREEKRRQIKYPDAVDGGMIAHRQRTGDDRSPEAVELISRAARGIARSTRRRLAQKGLLKTTQQFLTEGTTSTLENLLSEQVVKTLFVGFHGSGEHIKALGLDGKLPVVTATVNDILDAMRSDLQKPVAQLLREANEVTRRAKEAGRDLTSKERQRLEEIPDEISSITDQIVSALAKLDQGDDFAVENMTPDEVVPIKIRVAEFKKQYPKKWAIIKLRVEDGFSNKEIAEERGVSKSVTSEEFKEAVKLLFNFMRE